MAKRFEGTILALDLATQTGWAEADIDEDRGGWGPKVRSGSLRWAPQGSSPEAVFGGCLKWMAQRMQAFPPRLIVYEASNWQFMGGKTNKDTIRILAGLPAVVEAVAYRCNVRVMQAQTKLTRRWLLGANPRRDEAKRATIAAVQRLGYEVANDDEADAVATLLYSLAQLDDEMQNRLDVRILGGKP